MCDVLAWLQDLHPLDGAEELGAHCQGTALAAFVKQYFSVIQYDFLKRGYLCHAGLERMSFTLGVDMFTVKMSQRGFQIFSIHVAILGCLAGHNHGQQT